MKSLTPVLAATLLAASFWAHAQTEPASVSQTKALDTGPAPIAVAAPADAATAIPATATPATVDPKMTPAAMAARASTSHSLRGRAATAPPAKSAPGFKDGVTIRQGVVSVTQHGLTTPLADTATMTTLTNQRVSGDGTVTQPNGTTVKLQEGDYVSLSGRLTTAEQAKEQSKAIKEDLKEDRKEAAKRNRGLRGVLNNGF